MMTVPMDSAPAPSTREFAESLHKKNIELEKRLRKSAQSKVPSNPNTWLEMRENLEGIILADHDFSQQHETEMSLWQLHYRRIEEFRSHINSAMSAASQSNKTNNNNNNVNAERVKRIKSAFKVFLSEATGFYHELMLKIRSKYGLPLGYFSEGPESQALPVKDEKKQTEMKKGLMSCHRCLIYLGDLARYKGQYGEGDSVNREFAAASGYYMQAASLCPTSGNPHHQLGILATYSRDELVVVYRYFRSLAVEIPFSTARENLIIAFEKNRQYYSQLPTNVNTKASPVKTTPARPAGRGRGRGETKPTPKETKIEMVPLKEKEQSIPELFKAFCVRFIRLNGILFTKTSLETFEEVFSALTADFQLLLSSGQEEDLNFGSDLSDNSLFIVRVIAILIFTILNVKNQSDGQSYAEIVQRTVLLQNAFAATFELVGLVVKRCAEIKDTASSFLLPGILVYFEWLASHPDLAAGNGADMDEKQASARSLFWNQFLSLMNRLIPTGLVSLESDSDASCFFEMSGYDEGETGNRLALWEDFELRGFLPLVPAQGILDFSRKYGSGSDGGLKERKSRVERIFAAGRALTSVVQVGSMKIYFDPQSKKFVLATEPPPVVEDLICTGPANATKPGIIQQEHQQIVQSDANLYVEGEDDEVIVFKPNTFSEKPLSAAPTVPIATSNDYIQPPVKVSGPDWLSHNSVPFSTPLPQITTLLNSGLDLRTAAAQLPPTNWLAEQETMLSMGVNNFGISENGILEQQRLQRSGLGGSHPVPFSSPVPVPPGFSSTDLLFSQIKADLAIPSHNGILPNQLSSAGLNMPPTLDFGINSSMNLESMSVNYTEKLAQTVSKRNPVSRPVSRHVGPPPGFSHIPPKRQDGQISQISNSTAVRKEQSAQIDDYRWLDNYQLPSANGVATANNHANHAAYSYSNNVNVNASAGEKMWQDFQLFEPAKPYQEQQDVQPAQSLWSGRYFV